MTAQAVALSPAEDDRLLLDVRTFVAMNPGQEKAAVGRINEKLAAYVDKIRAAHVERISSSLERMKVAGLIYLHRRFLEVEGNRALRAHGDTGLRKPRTPFDMPQWMVWILNEEGVLQREDPFGEIKGRIWEYYTELEDAYGGGQQVSGTCAFDAIVTHRARLDPTDEGSEAFYRRELSNTDLLCEDLLPYVRLHAMVVDYLSESKTAGRYSKEEWWEILVVCRIWLDNECDPVALGLPSMANWETGKAWEQLREHHQNPHGLLSVLLARAVQQVDPSRLAEPGVVSLTEEERGGLFAAARDAVTRLISLGVWSLGTSAPVKAVAPQELNRMDDKPKRKRGRPPSHDAAKDKKLYDAWRASGMHSLVEFAREHGMTKEAAKHSIDRERKRRNKY